MTNLVQRSSHSRFSCKSQCSRGTPTLKHAWVLLSTVGTVWANDVILVNGPAIWGSASFWNEKGRGQTSCVVAVLESLWWKGKVAAFRYVCFFSFFYRGDNGELSRLYAHKSWSQIACCKSQNIEAWLEVFMWRCWKVLISGFRVCQWNLLFSAQDCNLAWRRL